MKSDAAPIATTHPSQEELRARLGQPFSVSASTLISIHSIESPFIIHWLETQADMSLDDMRRNSKDHGQHEHARRQAVKLYQAALNVANNWSTDEAITKRLATKVHMHTRPVD